MQGEEFKLRIRLKDEASAFSPESIQIECDWRLQQLLDRVKPAIKQVVPRRVKISSHPMRLAAPSQLINLPSTQRLANSRSLHESMVELTDVLVWLP